MVIWINSRSERVGLLIHVIQSLRMAKCGAVAQLMMDMPSFQLYSLSKLANQMEDLIQDVLSLLKVAKKERCKLLKILMDFSDDLLYYIKTYKHLLGNPNLVICLDSGASRPDCLSITSTLRGYLDFDLKVKVADNNMHSGISSGICPNPFQIILTLL